MLTAQKIKDENKLTSAQVFNIKASGKVYDNIQKVMLVIAKAQKNNDLEELDEITERPPLRYMGVNSILEMAEMDISDLCDIIDEWRVLAEQMFDWLPLEEQEHFIKHLDKGIVRKAYIDSIINDV